MYIESNQFSKIAFSSYENELVTGQGQRDCDDTF